MKIVFLLSIAIVLSSCAKMGCTDGNAMNFEKGVKKNDGSCTYEGKLGVWFDAGKAIAYSSSGVLTLTFFIDGVEKGTIPSSQYSSSTPTCDSPEVFLIDFSMGKASTANHSLLVKRETGVVIDSYAITVEGGKCSLFLLK